MKAPRMITVRLVHRSLPGIQDDEWGQGAYCFGAGYKTILDQCQNLPSHFQEHAAQIAASK